MISELAIDVLEDPGFKKSGLGKQDFIDLVRRGYTKVFKYVGGLTIEKYRENYPQVDLVEVEEGKHYFKLQGCKLTDEEMKELHQYEFDGKKAIKDKELNSFSDTREFTFIDDEGTRRVVTTAYINGMNFKTKDDLHDFVDSLEISENEKNIYHGHIDNLADTKEAIKEYSLNFVKAYEANKHRDFSTKASVESDL